MDKEKLTDLIRNILWAVLLILALIRGIASGHWKAFIILAVLFVISKSALLIGQRKLRKTIKELEGTLASQGRPSYVPKPSEIEAMQSKANAISNQIKKQCPPQPTIFFAIDHEKKPTIFDSKLGGIPYWDATKPYPTDANGRPMALAMQVNFEECPHIDPLPQSGILQFFITTDETVLEEGYGMDYDAPTSQKNCRVVYHEAVNRNVDVQQLGQYPRIEGLENSPVMGEYSLNATQGESYINRTCNSFEQLFANAVKQLYGDKVETPYFDDYLKRILPEEHRDEVDDALVMGDNPMYYGPTEKNFQMLGFPAFEQYDGRPEGCQCDTLLLQIPTIEDSQDGNWCTIWGDCGSARLFINADDLRHRNFSQVYFEYQCY
ncbi:MAG: DUF1963 domain-containing protein [Bacteroidales bacterium]|nr:DUF1963 domain-containing protein [Bacteroidales bacterium]